MPAWFAIPVISPARIDVAARWRGRRVLILVVATVLVALADLYMTLLYATSVGMHEANPLARALMLYNCPWIVVAFRVLTIALFGMVLIRARHRGIAEVASWVCMAAMVWLAFRWNEYNDSAAEVTGAMLLATGDESPEFISIGVTE